MQYSHQPNTLKTITSIKPTATSWSGKEIPYIPSLHKSLRTAARFITYCTPQPLHSALAHTSSMMFGHSAYVGALMRVLQLAHKRRQATMFLRALTFLFIFLAYRFVTNLIILLQEFCTMPLCVCVCVCVPLHMCTYVDCGSYPILPVCWSMRITGHSQDFQYLGQCLFLLFKNSFHIIFF